MLVVCRLSRRLRCTSRSPPCLNDPLSGRPGNNLTASARTGWSFVNGYRGEPPLQMPNNQVGYVGGVTGFITAAAALRRRDVGGCAELVDVSEVEAVCPDPAYLGYRGSVCGSRVQLGRCRWASTRSVRAAVGSGGWTYAFRYRRLSQLDGGDAGGSGYPNLPTGKT